MRPVITPTQLTRTAICLVAIPGLLLPLTILAYILFRGLPALDWSFISSAGEGEQFGASTGILPQIIGSLSLALGACLIASPFALGTALYYHLMASRHQKKWLLTGLQLLQGIPPIVFGLCGLIVFVDLLKWGISLITGMVILALVILPLLVINTIAALERIDPNQGESAQSLGLSHAAMIHRVWLPQAWPGILTGLLLAIARGLSETAPILFTATVFSGVIWPDSLFSPITTLQTHIFYLAQEGNNPAAITTAWGSAVVLIGLVSLCSLIARALRP